MKSPMTWKVAIAGALIAGLSTSAAFGQSSDDPLLVRQLAERALSGNFGGNVTLLPGKLVDTQPPLAVPPGWKLIGPIPTQILAPLIVLPTPGTRGSSSKPMPAIPIVQR